MKQCYRHYRIDHMAHCLYCQSPTFCRSMCVKHYSRWLRHGSPHRVTMRPSGAGQIDPRTGYVYVTHNGRRWLLHRLIMSQYLGRSLLRHEHVHHRNGNASDNRIDNLELLTHSQHSGEHYRLRNIDKPLRYYGGNVHKPSKATREKMSAARRAFWQHRRASLSQPPPGP